MSDVKTLVWLLFLASEGFYKFSLKFLMKSSSKADLKKSMWPITIFATLHGIWSHHFMANRWGNSGNSVRLYFLGSKITADGDCSHEIKRRLLLGRKVMTNLDSILKHRDITLPTKFYLVKAVVFPVVMDVTVGL